MKRKITLACLLVLSLLIVLTACKTKQDMQPSDSGQTSTEEEPSEAPPEQSEEQEEETQQKAPDAFITIVQQAEKEGLIPLSAPEITKRKR